MKLIKDKFEFSGGSLAYRIYEPEGEVRAVVQISHGMCEYVGRYEAYAEHLCSQGIVLAGNDHPGHGESAASVMLVVGSNLSGLEHNNWENNMRFATQLQSYISSIYPTLMRPINFRSQRFNQQLAPGGIIVEVGTNGNTLDEALLGAKYFAEGLAGFIKLK